MGYIYKITNTINDKVYIGKTIQSINRRWKTHLAHAKLNKKPFCDYHLYRAMNKYGIDKFSIHIIKEAPNESLSELEIKYIADYNSYNNGYNMTLGGDGWLQVDIEEIKHLWYSGLTITKISKYLNINYGTVSFHLKNTIKIPETLLDNRNSSRKKAINQYSLDGKYIKTFDCMLGVLKELNKHRRSSMHIKSCIDGKNKTAFGFIWKYDNGDHSDLEISYLVENNYKQHCKSVNQYSLDGKYLKTYKSTQEAATTNNINSSSNIQGACKGKHKFSHGYIWRYTSDEFPEGIDIQV